MVGNLIQANYIISPPFLGTNDLEIKLLIDDNSQSPFFKLLVQLHLSLISEFTFDQWNKKNTEIFESFNKEKNDFNTKNFTHQETINFCSLLTRLRDQQKICPIHREWNKLYKNLPDTIMEGSSHEWIPPSPYVLGGWYDSSDEQKSARFKTHLIYTLEHNYFDRFVLLLNKIPQDQWHYTYDRI